MKTHSDQKNFSCNLCEASFRTKGSLIRHNRRHTGTNSETGMFLLCIDNPLSFLLNDDTTSFADERPYRCNQCGQSFRESGALTRHLKALTPCTEKIRFVQFKEILVSKDGVQRG